MDLSKSIFSLVKYNNGFFKSEKQSDFLIKMIKEEGGCIGVASSGYNSCPIFAEYDSKGITRLVKSAKNGDQITFERKQEGVLTSLEVKKIKSLKRELKSLIKDHEESLEAWDNGTYNKKNPDYRNDPFSVKLFNERRSIESEKIEGFKKRISEIESS